MRILVAHSFYRLAGGEDRYVRQQVDLLAGHHEVHLEERVNARLSEGPGTALRMMRAPDERPALRRSIAAFRPDVIHLHNPYPSFGPEIHLAAVEAGVPLVQTAHNFRLRCPNGLLFTQGEPCMRCVAGRYDNAVRHQCFPTRSQAAAYAQGLWFNRFVRRLDDKVDLYVAPSRFVRRRLVEWGIPAERTAVVRNFTSVAAEAPPLGERGMYLGRLSPEKGVATLLEALRLAGDPPFEIVGGGPAGQELRTTAARLQLRNTRFRGLVPAADVPALIAEARYTVVPSTWDENAPLAVLEAMAAGRPVIASDAGGLPELVETGRGLLTRPGNPQVLASAISRYVDDPAAAALDGSRAREFVVAECSPAAHRASLEAAYAAAIALQRRRAGGGAVPHPARRAVTRTALGSSVHPPRFRPPHGRSTELGHILMAHCYYRDLGGENLSYEAEVHLLREAGYRVTTYTRDNRELDGIGHLRRIRAGLRTTWAEDSYGELRGLVRRERPDVVHFQNTFPLISPGSLHAVHRLGVPVVCALRNYRIVCAGGVLYRDGAICTDCVGRALPDPGVRHACYHDSALQSTAVAVMQVTHRVLGTWMDAVDLYVAPSAFARDPFVAAGLPADRVVVKPNFVDPDPGVGSGEGGFVLYAGRLAPEKGVKTLVEAWAADDLPPLRIAGGGPIRPAIEALVVARSLEDRVTIVGHCSPEGVLDMMRDARCVVFPSEWYETFGRVAAEAYACGVPVVASRLGAMAEIVEDGVTGRLFTPGDPADLARAVRETCRAGAAYDAMRRAARAAYEAKYTAARNLDQLLEIYARAGARHRRDCGRRRDDGGRP